MSQEHVEIVRQPLRVRDRSSRTLDERLSLRFPWLIDASSWLIAKLPPRSRLRRAALSRAVRLASEAYNRRDLDALVIAYHPELEYYPGREWVRAGLAEPCYQGREGYRRYVAATSEVWGDENYLMPSELIDLGDRFVLLATVPMRGQASGIRLNEAFAYVGTLKDGKVVRLQEFYDHAEALEAAGLRA
jgi:ketosteroid isomerase-like protein